jgi:isopropylmalate/homocitrate/citramalate synthase
MSNEEFSTDKYLKNQKELYKYFNEQGSLLANFDEYSPGTREMRIKETNYDLPSMTPFVGRNFNLTRAGIHADGLMKDPEIYNIFDTDNILNRPPLVAVSNTSGLAGIACWINNYYRLSGTKAVSKNDSIVKKINDWVEEEYKNGRVTVISDEELVAQMELYGKDILSSLFA